MLVFKLCLLIVLFLAMVRAESSSFQLSPRSLDSLLQDYGFRAFVRPKTGVPYEGNVPSTLSGIKVSVLRLRSGSLRRKGFDSYKEFRIPSGVIEQPHVERLVLVYHNLANWSSFFYPLPGYTHLAPVLGLLSYNASNLTAADQPELDIRASGEPISINFGNNVQSAPDGSSPKCVYFDLQGSVEFENVIDGNICSTRKQGHFSIVVESSAPSPASTGRSPSSGGKRNSREWKIAVPVVVGVLLLILLGILAAWVRKYRRRKKVRRMEQSSELGLPLPLTAVGNAKVPVATGTRTRPLLENTYVP